MAYAATQTKLPNTVFSASKNSSAPVPVQQLGALGVNVIVYNKDVRKTFNGGDAFAGLASDVGYKSGSLVIKGYENNVQRGASNPGYKQFSGKPKARNNPETFPAGLYLESSQPNVSSRLLVPLAQVLEVIQAGGFIYVFLNCTKSYGAATNSDVASTTFVKNGAVQANTVTTTTPNANGAVVWAQVQIANPGAAITGV